MSNFVKLFASILDSTIWDTPPAITKVWITMMAMANRDGVVESSVPGLSRRARVDLATTEKALALFMEPDKYSKTPEYEGRRIAIVDGGWVLLNYSKHREMMSHEDIREKNAERQRKWRERQQVTLRNAKSPYVTADSAGNDIGEAEEGSVSSSLRSSSHQTGARSNENADLGPIHERPVIHVGACTPAFLAVYDAYPRKEGKQPAAQVFQDIAQEYPGGEDALSAAILAEFGAGMLLRAPYHGPNRTRPMLDRMLAERRWEDPPSAPDDEPETAESRTRRDRSLKERLELDRQVKATEEKLKRDRAVVPMTPEQLAEVRRDMKTLAESKAVTA